jgi:phytoene synthase
MSSDLKASYAWCRRIARRSASNFYYSFLMLPRAKRSSMCALYAFLRRTDDLGDSSESQKVRRKALWAWRTSLARSLAGSFDDPLLPALVDTVKRFEIPDEYLYAVIDGVETDLENCRYETFQDLEEYCYRVASAVGIACIHIWGFRSEAAMEPARQCGLAFQLTNILRDLKEDAAHNRVYLPQEDLRRFDYSVEELNAGVCNESFRALMRFEIERAEGFYRQAHELDRWLEPEGRRVFGTMLATYGALLDEMKSLDGDVLSARVALSGWRKIQIAARWYLFQPPPVLVGTPVGAAGR